MNRSASLRVLSLAFLASWATSLPAQNQATPQFAVAPLNRQALELEDDLREQNGLPARFALVQPVDVSATNDGAWDPQPAAGTAHWRLSVYSPGASHINLTFDDIKLPAGWSLTLSAQGLGPWLRPFTSADINPAGELWTPIVPGNEVFLDLKGPNASRAGVTLHLSQVNSGYRFFGAGTTATALIDGSGSCNIDVNCPQGDNWRDEIPAVAAYSTGGSIFCTGVMVNNTAQDQRNLFLTANHCGIRSNNAGSMVVYWNYEEVNCNNVGTGQLNQFSLGATFRARKSSSDFALVELNNSPNPAWGITYAGWNAQSGNASSAVAIHHPSGDAKKISFENQATTTTSYGGTSQSSSGTHVRVIDWDLGTTEPGSSGSPLFDQNHRIIGQLHGGGAACGNNLSDWYGRVSVSWNGSSSSNRLRDWLDPLNTGALTLDTLNGSNGSPASATPFGTGCYEGSTSVYQTFSPNAFDLSGQSLSLTPNAQGGYTVQAGSLAWTNPFTADLNLGDDDTQTANLGFTFAYPGGSTSSISICSNGYIWLDSTQSGADFSATVAELLDQAPRLAPLWEDLNPAAGGSIHFQSVGGRAVITWLGVPEYFSTGAQDVQCVLYSDGRVEFHYRSVTNANDDAIVGFSPGAGASDPNTVDLSSTTVETLAQDSEGLALIAQNTPVLGQTLRMEAQDLPPTASSVVIWLGFTRFQPAIDLAPFSPGCFQSVTYDLPLFTLRLGPIAIATAGVPNDPTLVGGTVYSQALAVAPGTNILGVVTSNGVELTLGQN